MSGEKSKKNNKVKEHLSGKVPIEKIVTKVIIGRDECIRTVKGKKASVSKKGEKIYTVTVTYIQQTDEEIKNKRAILENIVKRNNINNPTSH